MNQSKTIFITGGNTGLGLETARQLAAKASPCKIFLACRSREKAQEAIANIQVTVPSADIEFVQLDLSDLRSVQDCARSFVERNLPIDVLILNAGLNFVVGKTAQGHEMQFGVNHLGHFLLTKLLLSKVKQAAPSSRIVVLTSNLHSMVKESQVVNLEALTQAEYSSRMAALSNGYSVSKLFNNWFTHELATQLEGTAVTVNCVHPGAVNTDILRSAPQVLQWVVAPISKLFFRTVEQGAQTSVFLASDPSVECVTNKYFVDCKVAADSPLATDKDLQKKAWDLSEKLVADFVE